VAVKLDIASGKALIAQIQATIGVAERSGVAGSLLLRAAGLSM
jgi:hypothetical protein